MRAWTLSGPPPHQVSAQGECFSGWLGGSVVGLLVCDSQFADFGLPLLSPPSSPNTSGYLYDPLDSFAFYRNGTAAFGSRSNVTLQVRWVGRVKLVGCWSSVTEEEVRLERCGCALGPAVTLCPLAFPADLSSSAPLLHPSPSSQDCMISCQQAPDCEAFVINEALQQCYLKKEQCPSFNSWCGLLGAAVSCAVNKASLTLPLTHPPCPVLQRRAAGSLQQHQRPRRRVLLPLRVSLEWWG